MNLSLVSTSVIITFHVYFTKKKGKTFYKQNICYWIYFDFTEENVVWYGLLVKIGTLVLYRIYYICICSQSSMSL